MKVKFHDEHLGMLAENKASVKTKFPDATVKKFRKRLAAIKAATSTQDLRALGSLHFEKLVEKRYDGLYSIKIDYSYRLIFQIDKEDNLEIMIIEEMNNHYAKK